jgi:nucleoid DNA-binding protein
LHTQGESAHGYQEKSPCQKSRRQKGAGEKATTKAAVKKAPATTVKKVKAIKEAMTKTAMLQSIADETGLTRKQVGAVMDSLSGIIESHVKKGAAGTCTIPGLMKIKTLRKPAQKARKNVPNPFKPGETMDVAAKPARTVVKILPLKKLKDMAG